MLLTSSGVDGVVPLPERAGMTVAMRMASTGAVCSHTDDAVGSVMPGCVGCFPKGAVREPWVSSRERKAMLPAKRLWIAVIMLLVFWSLGAIIMDYSVLKESTGKPASRSAVPQEHANTTQEPSPMLVAQWRQGPQANACACPAIICSELQRSEACRVSCARGRSAYCQCGSCNGIALSSPNYCGCR